MGLFQKNKELEKGVEGFIDLLIQTKTIELSVKRKAICHAIDLIASTISKCEIKHYRYDIKEKKVLESKDDIYYKLNVQPNKNEIATSFLYRLVSNLLFYEEILIVELNHELFISTKWTPSQTIFYEKSYQNIQIEDENENVFLLKKTIYAKDVIHLSIKSKKIKECLDDYFSGFGNLLDVSYQQYLTRNANKWRLTHGGIQFTLKNPDGKKLSYEEYVKTITEGLFGHENKVLLLPDNLILEDLNASKDIPPEKILKLLEKAENDVCKSFTIPQDLYHGNKTDKSTSTGDFFTFAVIPILQLIEDGFNAKMKSKEQVLKGEKLVFNRWNLKHMDILEAASGIDKLFSDGFSHNEICGFLNVQQLDEEWAYRHYITKNYELAENSLKGGGKDE